jgi:hypothetical protein
MRKFFRLLMQKARSMQRKRERERDKREKLLREPENAREREKLS